jgi:hypothetical protein
VKKNQRYVDDCMKLRFPSNPRFLADGSPDFWQAGAIGVPESPILI